MAKARHFPRDKYFLPTIDQTLKDVITEGGGQIDHGWRLEKVLVRPSNKNQAHRLLIHPGSNKIDTQF